MVGHIKSESGSADAEVQKSPAFCRVNRFQISSRTAHTWVTSSCMPEVRETSTHGSISPGSTLRTLGCSVVEWLQIEVKWAEWMELPVRIAEMQKHGTTASTWLFHTPAATMIKMWKVSHSQVPLKDGGWEPSNKIQAINMCGCLSVSVHLHPRAL